MKRLAILIILFFCVLFVTGDIYAQNVSLSLSPPLVQVVIKPGKSVLIAYTLKNSGDPAIISSQVLPFTASGQNGQIKVQTQMEGPVRFSLDNSNITLNQSFFLNSRQSQQLLLKIRIPEGITSGDYYYTFLASSEPPQGAGTNNSGAKVTIGSNILISVSPDGYTEARGSITELSTISPYTLHLFGKTIKIFESTDVIPIRLVIRNEGQNLVSPEGSLILKGNLGEKATYDLLNQNILSNSERLIHASNGAQINCEDHMKSYYCRQDASLFLKGFFLGGYHVSTSLTFGEGTQTLFSSTNFYAFPIKYTIGILIGVIIILVMIMFIKRLSDQSEEY
jgi:hypothetical protein